MQVTVLPAKLSSVSVVPTDVQVDALIASPSNQLVQSNTSGSDSPGVTYSAARPSWSEKAVRLTRGAEATKDGVGAGGGAGSSLPKKKLIQVA